MADRNTPASFTFEEWRVEFNELASDVGDIGNLPASINGNAVTDIVEAVTELEGAISNVLFPNVIDFDDSPDSSNERIKMGASDDMQLYHDGSNSYVSHDGGGDLNISSTSDLTVNATTGVNLQFNGSTRLDTTADGINVTGDVQLSGNITNGSTVLQIGDTSGRVATEGFSVAMGIALG
jgi:hypothetical protein